MRFRALVAVLGLLAACAVQPDPIDNTPTVEQVQPASFNAPHGLQFKVVDDGDTVMRELFEHVALDRDRKATDPVAIANGVSADLDRWRTEEGAFTDFYLTANAPGVLARYVSDAAARDPALAVPGDRELAFEQLEPGRWRTVLLFPTAELDASAIAGATASLDPASEQPLVTLELTPAATRHFGELTARISGHKLAVLVDGTVTSAPIIRGAIRGGHASITLGNGASELDAQRLADSLVAR